MYILKYGKGFLLYIISIIVLSIIITAISLLNLIDQNTISYLKIAVLIISAILSGLYIGKKASKRRFVDGIKMGLIIIVISFFISLLIKSKLCFSSFVYYLIILLSTTLGSIFVKPKN